MYKNLKNKFPFILMVVLVMLICLSFAWGEKFNCHAKINSSKVGDLGTVIGSLFTSLTIYLLYRQISETIKDRKAAHQPELYPYGGKFNTTDKITKIADYERKDPEFFVGMKNEKKFYVQIHNIGLGVAKEIEYHWLYDEKAVEKYVGNDYGSDLFKNSIFETRLNFLAPNKSLEINLPTYYMYCFGVSTSLERKNITKPQLKLQLSYNDIYNNNHSRLYQVEIDNFFMIQFNMSFILLNED